MDSLLHSLLWVPNLRSREFTVPDAAASPAICVTDVATDSHTSHSFVKISCEKLRKGVDIFLGTTGTPLCPVKAVPRYVAIRPKTGGPLLVHADGSPLLRDQFVRMVKSRCALRTSTIRITLATVFRTRCRHCRRSRWSTGSLH